MCNLFNQRVQLGQEAVLKMASALGFDGDEFDVIQVLQVGPRHIRFGIIGYELNLAGELGDIVDIGCVEIAFRNKDGLKFNPFDIVSTHHVVEYL